MLREIIRGLYHLFHIKYLGPPHIPDTFSDLELYLNVNQQIDLRQICWFDRLLARRMFLLTDDDGQQLLQSDSLRAEC